MAIETELDINDSEQLRYIAAQAADARVNVELETCLLYTSPSPRDGLLSRMPSSA